MENKESIEPDSRIQTMRVIQRLAGQLGLRFKHHQIWKGPRRGKRIYILNRDSVKRMLDLGQTDWDRLQAATIPLNEEEELTIADLLAG